MDTGSTRREILAKGAFAAGVIAAGGTNLASDTEAESRISYKRKSPASTNLVKVGVVLGRFTHTKNIWYRFTNPVPETARRTGMIITHYWTF